MARIIYDKIMGRKVWAFETLSEADSFYKEIVKELKDSGAFIRLPGNPYRFFIKGKPRSREFGYEVRDSFSFSRSNRRVLISWHSKELNKRVPFSQIFENASDEDKKTLAFHFDIFA